MNEHACMPGTLPGRLVQCVCASLRSRTRHTHWAHSQIAVPRSARTPEAKTTTLEVDTQARRLPAAYRCLVCDGDLPCSCGPRSPLAEPMTTPSLRASTRSRSGINSARSAFHEHEFLHGGFSTDNRVEQFRGVAG